MTQELEDIADQPEEINDRFYRNLEFGMGGLRGVLGVRTNRVNIYTVRKATQGLTNYLDKKKSDGMIAVVHDSRINSELSTREAAGVLVVSGIAAHLYPELMSTPALSFAVRYLYCDAGIDITASYNPAKYNGYKAYDSNGCQIALEVVDHVLEEISSLDIFSDVKHISCKEDIEKDLIQTVPQRATNMYIEVAKSQNLLRGINDGLKVIYTPLNGAGRMCVTRVLKEIGVNNVTVVPEQAEPDGNFPTCSYPNPEFHEALQKRPNLSEHLQPDLPSATNPNNDRVGTAVRCNGGFVLLNGSGIDVLLLDFVARMRRQNGIMLEHPTVVSAIVSTDTNKAVTAEYGIKLFEVFTGFKYIGGKVRGLETKGERDRSILGYEESYGYLTGNYVCDKDAVDTNMLICEMALYYKHQGKTLAEVMGNLYQKHGHYINNLLNFTFEGQDGVNKMSGVVDVLRKATPEQITGHRVIGHSDYETRIRFDDEERNPIGLSKSNVSEYRMEDDCKLMVRSPGMEPKIGVYLSARGAHWENALEIIGKLKEASSKLLGV